ncbi:MAG TPA: class I SAM-dependent methyltransferase [Bacteroidia bacterium]|nr:class I SAM-dependent methyltransferase [Bacteroidia bacterium]
MISSEIENYVTSHSTSESEVLKKVNRETYAKVLMPRMLSGHLQGKVLKMFSEMIRPTTILEIGTFTGYSAICLCSGLQQNGKLITMDINEELEPMVKQYFSDAKLLDKIEYRIGNALNMIPLLDEKFELVFIDADKKNYAAYYDLVFDKVVKGGYIIADNVLWDGKIIFPNDKMDNETKAIDAFNKKINADERVENLILPIRDGLMIAKKLI